MTPFERLQYMKSNPPMPAIRPGSAPGRPLAFNIGGGAGQPRELVGALNQPQQTPADRRMAMSSPMMADKAMMQSAAASQMAAPPAMPPQPPQGQPQQAQEPLSGFRSPMVQQGLLGLGMGLLEASGPSTTPVSFGQAMSRGMNAGVGMMEQERGNQMQERMYGLREQQIEADNAEAAAKADELQAQRASIEELMRSPGIPDAVKTLGPDAVMQFAKTHAGELAKLPDTPAGTAAMQDAAALGLQPGTPAYEKYIMDRTLKPQSVSTTNVNMPTPGPQFGTVAPGYMMVQTGPNLWEQMPVPGGPVDREMQEAAAKAEGLEATKNIARGTVVQDAGRALEMIERQGDLVSGPVAAASRHLPGTPAYVLQGHIDSIGSNIGLDVLQTMRENSPTGGALGQVPIQQQQRLEAVYGNLALGQPAEVIADNLKRIDNIYNDLIHGTPAEIQKMVDEGKISADAARPLMERHTLSFDDRGRPARPTPGEVQGASDDIESLLDRWAPQ